MSLVLSRKKGESIVIGWPGLARVRVKVMEVRQGAVRIHVDGPLGVEVLRAELEESGKDGEGEPCSVCGEPGHTRDDHTEPFEPDAERPRGELPVFVWRLNAEEFATQVGSVLSEEELGALAGEMALAWRMKRIAMVEAQAKADREEVEVFRRRPV